MFLPNWYFLFYHNSPMPVNKKNIYFYDKISIFVMDFYRFKKR